MRLVGGFKRGGRIRVAECLRQNCSKQMGQRKKAIFHQILFVCLLFTKGWQRFVCRMRIVIVLLEYKVEGDRTDNEGPFQRWNWSRELISSSSFFYFFTFYLFIECDALLVQNSRTEWMWSDFLALSPFLIGRTFVREHSWDYSANIAGS